MIQEQSRAQRTPRACKNAPRQQDLWPLFLQKTELFLDCDFRLLTDVENRNEFTSDYSLLLAAANEQVFKLSLTCLYGTMILSHVACYCDCF